MIQATKVRAGRLRELAEYHRNHGADNPAERRLQQARRQFAVAAILAGCRSNYMSVHNVTEELNERTGETWNSRTVRRDLTTLIELGIVKKFAPCSASNREKPGSIGSKYKWTGQSPNLARVVIQVAEQSARHQCGTGPLKAFLSSLPDPWDMDAERHRIATHAARLVAMTESNSAESIKAQLVFRLGEGWTLQYIDGEALSAFDRIKPVKMHADQQYRQAIEARQEALLAS